MRLILPIDRLYTATMAPGRKDAVSFDEIIQAGELHAQLLRYSKLLTLGKGEHNAKSRSLRMRSLGKGEKIILPAMAIANRALVLALQAELALPRFAQ